jgi:hypothetical protein
MRTIWMYELVVADRQSLKVPEYFKPVSVQMQNGYLCIWAIVNTKCNMKTIRVHVSGTGHDIGMTPESAYIGTVQVTTIPHPLVVHVFAEDIGVS